MFLAVMSIVAISCIAITYKTLVGYGQFAWWIKLLTFILLCLAWFSPVWIHIIRHMQVLGSTVYAVLAKIGYFLMGFAFVLLVLLLVREFIWYLIYYISRNQNLSPDNIGLLHRNNIRTLALALIISGYGVYAANRLPQIKTFTIEDERIKENTRMVVVSDLHIDKAVSLSRIKNIVEKINSLQADYVLLVGDVVDDVPMALSEEMKELQKIKAEKVYLSLGNHEYYNEAVKWMIAFTNMGFYVLHNTGEMIDDKGIFVGGIPDANSVKINLRDARYGAQDNAYKILMSHAPSVVDTLEKGQFDLQVSGHTHGGQIFPFHFLVKASNHYLAGQYDVNGNQLIVSRGAGYWGPPMRILSPSDIVVLDFKGVNNE